MTKEKCSLCGKRPATREYCYPAEPWRPICSKCRPQYQVAGMRELPT
jgi:hypothetical protein